MWLIVKREDKGKEKEKRVKKSSRALRDVWDCIKKANICVVEVPEEEDKENEMEVK